MHRPAKLAACLAILALSVLAPAPANAQDADQAIRKRMQKLQRLLSDGAYAEASRFMTSSGADDYATNQVLSAVMNVEMTREMKRAMGSMAKNMGFGSTEKLEGVMKTYGLDKLNLATELRKMTAATSGQPGQRGQPGIGSGAGQPGKPGKPGKSISQKDYAAAMAGISKKVLKAIDKDKKRWEIVARIREANQSNPFSAAASGSLEGKIQSVELSKDKKSAVVLMKSVPKKKKPGKNGGMMMMTMGAVSTVDALRLVQQDGKWLYDGIDEKRTNKLREKALKAFESRAGNGPDSEQLLKSLGIEGLQGVEGLKPPGK